MALLTLQQVFGSNATQNSTTITFLKSDLLGLTPQGTNTADSIFAAIINTTHRLYEGNVTDQNSNAVTDQNGNVISYDNRYYYTASWVTFWGYLMPPGKVNSIFILSLLTSYTPS